MRQYLESLVVFALVLGVWTVFAFVVAILASFLPGEEMVEFVGGGVSTLGLIAAVGVAARLVGKTRACFSNSGADTH